MRIACPVKKSRQHAIRIRNTHRFPTATIVTRTRPNVTLYAHRLPCGWYSHQSTRGQNIRRFGGVVCIANTPHQTDTLRRLCPAICSYSLNHQLLTAFWSQVVTIHTNKGSTNNPPYLGRGWGTSKHNCLVSYLLCWRRHVSTTVRHLQVTKIYIEENYTEIFCDVLLTVHLSIILVINQLNAQNLLS